ncbi:SepM family pheromone-processing serine protease [Tepidibacillus fermentans]|uniref:endopeptidase La n=1 Tax=Tepidibacillus fermentans TaxID=1281767 RepID=A0A4R3K981_9BACI|nr:SepM family pheromone-processing serine protease [Tepidibacillus fermentans]TCS79231.1 PDZ domain-containing protein [Tepidibacillus fermentans]
MNDLLKKKYLIFKMKRLQWLFLLLIVLGYLSFYIPIPYYIASPGVAVKLRPIITVEKGYREKGDFMLTTIRMGQGNLGYYIYSRFLPNIEYIPKEYVLNQDEDPEQYEKRQLQVMKQSQDDAIIAAFQQANLPIEVKQKGILVEGIVRGMPAEKVLQVGDVITKVNQKPIYQLKDFLSILEEKKTGDKISITFLRNRSMFTKEVKLVSLTKESNETGQRVGLGFYPSQEQEVIPAKKVSFHTEEIGGPSAGLMFTLEIINQLIPEDLTRGYQIAGTGTISPDGIVGQIGGAKLKVHAAAEAGAEIFFVPKDIKSTDTNQKDVENENRKLAKPMKIVPVANVNEAIQFLKQLPNKNKTTTKKGFTENHFIII